MFLFVQIPPYAALRCLLELFGFEFDSGDVGELWKSIVDVLAVHVEVVVDEVRCEILLLHRLLGDIDEGNEFLATLYYDTFLKVGEREYLVFYLLWVDVLTICSEKHSLLTSTDEEIAVLVECTEVARV